MLCIFFDEECVKVFALLFNWVFLWMSFHFLVGGRPVTPRTRRVVCRYPSAGAAGPSSGAETRYGLPWRGRELRSFCLKVRGSAVWKAQEGSGVRGGK